MGMDLNTLFSSGAYKCFHVKPEIRKKGSGAKKAKWEKNSKDGILFKDFGKLLLMLMKDVHTSRSYKIWIVTSKTHTTQFIGDFTARDEKSAKRKVDHDFARLMQVSQRLDITNKK